MLRLFGGNWIQAGSGKTNKCHRPVKRAILRTKQADKAVTDRGYIVKARLRP